MKEIQKAHQLYSELIEEFEKGDPNSDVNKSCNTREDVAVYAMLRFNATTAMSYYNEGFECAIETLKSAHKAVQDKVKKEK